ncbi:hypothetical protein IJM86_00370, partial [bacterium]|nr:hypothetical protein [bacterium]
LTHSLTHSHELLNDFIQHHEFIEELKEEIVAGVKKNLDLDSIRSFPPENLGYDYVDEVITARVYRNS